MKIINRSRNNRPEVAEIGRVELVSHCTYRGSEVDYIGGCEREVNRRAQMARNGVVKLNRIWREDQTGMHSGIFDLSVRSRDVDSSSKRKEKDRLI